MKMVDLVLGQCTVDARLRLPKVAVAVALLAATLAGSGGAALAERPPAIVTGQITWVSDSALEVSGQRARLSSETTIQSDGHPVGVNSLHKGMNAVLEVDEAGRALSVQVEGVVE